jgi:hypothetical protein
MAKRYEIEARLKFPSCHNSGYNFEVIANNKAEAIKRARREIGNHGHTRQDGAITYTATEVED